MRRSLFSVYNVLEVFLKKIESFLVGIGLSRIPGIVKFYNLKRNLSSLMYHRLKPKGIVLAEVEGNKVYVNADDLGIVRVILTEGVWEKYQTELFKKMVREEMVVVDIGALFGHYSLIGSKLVGSSGIVYAFEPVPSHYELLCKNIKVNGYNNIVPIQKAVSNKTEKVNIWVDKFNIASATICEDNALPLFGYNVSEKASIQVETITLDEFFENRIKNNKVDFIKMDVGGVEGLIIDGAERILRSNDLKVFMEFWPDGLKKLGSDPLKLLYKLQKYGFIIKLINETKQVLEPIEPLEFCRAISKKPGHQEFNLLLEK